MRTEQFFAQLLVLEKPYTVSSVKYNQGPKRQIMDVEVHIEIEKDYRPPTEGGVKISRHDVEKRSWRHLDLFQYPCYLHCEVPKFKYDDGQKQWYKTLEVPWARAQSGFTLLFEHLVMHLLEVHGCPARVAKGVQEYPQRIWTIVNHYVPVESLAIEAEPAGGEEEELIALETLQAEVAVEEGTWAGIRSINFDETSRKKGHDYVTNFIDGQTGALLDVQVGKGAKVVEAFVNKAIAKGLRPLQIEEVNIDMSAAFQKGAAVYFPNARINFDKFHVSALVSRALDVFRKSQARKLGKRLPKWPILKPVEQLGAQEYGQLCEVLGQLPELEQFHQHKNCFSNLWAFQDSAEGAAFLSFWVDRAAEMAQQFKSRKLQTLANTLNRHFEGIVNVLISANTNAVAEGMHSKMQAMKRTARGYKTFHRFVQMIRVHCQGGWQHPTQFT